MKISSFVGALSLSTIVLAATTIESNAGAVSPAPLTGNGISPSSLKPLHISLTLTPANNDGVKPRNLGTFMVEAERPRDAHGMEVKLNIFQAVNGQEQLVTTVSMDGMAQVLGGPGGFGRPAAFFASLDDKNKFPAGLKDGYYRAEAVVYALTPPISKPMQSDRHWVEAGGAAVDFYVGFVNLLPVADVSGGVQVTATVAARRGATSSQLAQLNAEAKTRVAKVFTGAKGIFESQMAVGRGEPTRNAWFVVSSYAPNGLSASLQVSSGQSYRHLIPQLNNSISTLVRGGTTVVTLPGGTISLRTTSTLGFSK